MIIVIGSCRNIVSLAWGHGVCLPVNESNEAESSSMPWIRLLRVSSSDRQSKADLCGTVVVAVIVIHRHQRRDITHVEMRMRRQAQQGKRRLAQEGRRRS